MKNIFVCRIFTPYPAAYSLRGHYNSTLKIEYPLPNGDTTPRPPERERANTADRKPMGLGINGHSGRTAGDGIRHTSSYTASFGT